MYINRVACTYSFVSSLLLDIQIYHDLCVQVKIIEVDESWEMQRMRNENIPRKRMQRRMLEDMFVGGHKEREREDTTSERQRCKNWYICIETLDRS